MPLNALVIIGALARERKLRSASAAASRTESIGSIIISRDLRALQEAAQVFSYTVTWPFAEVLKEVLELPPFFSLAELHTGTMLGHPHALTRYYASAPLAAQPPLCPTLFTAYVATRGLVQLPPAWQERWALQGQLRERCFHTMSLCYCVSLVFPSPFDDSWY